MRIDIWSDIACPWCYLGLTRLEAALARFEHGDAVEVLLHSFQLDPTLPESFAGTEAEYLATSKGLDTAMVEQMFTRVSAAAAPDGLKLGFDTLVVANSRRAHRLLQQAKLSDPSGRTTWKLEVALFEAHFSDGRNIGDPSTLVELAVGAGLDADAARQAIDSPARDAEVAADIDAAAQLGIRGVPFFVLADKYGVSGAQPPEAFDQALRQVWDELAASALR
ncbi:MAG TPA: DsbA family oxidoreductase [Propionicimonas sp.]|uniref:DsbA family oxidoreductase n=1 Tax=Propionicimonas sp. TaxID=1955623 RepID=UPI002F4269D9